VYKEVWTFHKKHSVVRLDSAYWDSVVEDMGDICHKYDYNPFVVSLCMSVLEELERKQVLVKKGDSNVSTQ